MASPRSVRIHRVYDHDHPVSGHLVLVDRLWPRGVRKADLEFDEWCKDVAPSTELRCWASASRSSTWAPARASACNSRVLPEPVVPQTTW